MRAWLIILGLIGNLYLICSPLFLVGQDDSTRLSPPPDSLSFEPAPTLPPRTPIPGEDTLGKIPTRDSAIPDWGKQLEKAPKGPIARVRVGLTRYQNRYGPRIFTRPDGKTRLYISFPRRDSLVIPYPKGLLPTRPGPPYDPVVAWQRSALIPGWGQAYNRSYWKMPIWWAGYGAIGWWLNFNHVQYRVLGDAYFCAAVQGEVGCTIPSNLTGSDTEGLRTQRNAFRQRRDNAILWLIGWHSLQVIEAFIDAHMSSFDVSDDLTGHLAPASPIAAVGIPAPSLGLAWRF